MTTVENDIEFEEDKEGVTLTVKSPKRNCSYIIYKPEDGFSMFKIKSNAGQTPGELDGMYTNRKKALQDLLYFLVHAKESISARYERVHGTDEKAPPLKTKKDIGVATTV